MAGPFSAADIACYASIARDRWGDEPPDRLAYCAEVLRRLEEDALRMVHMGTTDVRKTEARETVTMADAARIVGVAANTLRSWVMTKRVTSIPCPPRGR